MGTREQFGEDETRALHGFTLTATVLVTSFAITCFAAFDVAGLRDRLEGYLDLWPQNWAFFVDLDRDLLLGYRATPGTPHLSPLTERQGWRSWSWSLGRRGSAQSVELREVGRRIPDQYWHSCAASVSANCGELRNRVQVYQAKNQAVEPRLCGPIAIAVERTATPADNRLPALPRQVHRIAFVDLECGT